MGFEDSSQWKKFFETEFPSGYVTVERAAEALDVVEAVVVDGTGLIFTIMSGLDSPAQRHATFASTLSGLAARYRSARTFHFVFDVEERKPKCKRILRDKSGPPPLTTYDAELWRDALLGSHADWSEATNFFARDQRSPGRHLHQRMMRTRVLREAVTHTWIEALMESFLTIQSIDELIIDDYNGKRCTIIRGNMSTVDIEDDKINGEADLGMIEAVQLALDGNRNNVLILSRDTDMLAISLLRIPGLSPLPANLLLDLSSFGKFDSIYEMTAVHQAISTLHFSSLPVERHPSIALVVLMMITGTDYIERSPGLGFATARRFFEGAGYAFFGFPDDVPLRRIIYAFIQCLMHCDTTGASSDRVARFETLRGLVALKENEKREPMLAYLEPIVEWASVVDGTRDRRKGQLRAREQGELRALAARCEWNLCYWMGKKGVAEASCDVEDGCSKWGWTLSGSEVAPALDAYMPS